MVDWRTAASMAPGVQRGSGLENSPEPRARQEPGGGWRWTTCAEAWLTASAGSEARDAAGDVPAAPAVGLASATATSSAAPAASRIAIALQLVIVSQANARLGPQLRSGADSRPREVGPRSDCFGASSARVSCGVAVRSSFARGDLVLLSRDVGSRRR